MLMQIVCVCTQPLLSTLYLLTFKLIINTALKASCEAKDRGKSNHLRQVKDS